MGMTRLSIVDVAGGHQPIDSEDGAVTVVCNGEIYNHAALRRGLEARGHRFRTSSDVEVIVHLYEERGAGFLAQLRGMFAVALWDHRTGRLLLARDRLGIKPLFYAIQDGRVLFASEIKALARSALVRLDLDLDALDLFLTFGYIPAPHTIYRAIRKLEPGHVLTCAGGRVTRAPYWSLQSDPSGGRIDEREAAGRVLDLLRESVRMHLMSDVPLGAFLSGGLDSSLLVALMSEASGAPVRTFTMGFGGSRGRYVDERQYARLVSQRYGTAHTEFEVEPRVDEVLDDIVDAFDEPFADDSVIPSHVICRLARRSVTVVLTGLGGDELFGGYERHLGLMWSARYARLPAALRHGVVAPLVNRLPEPPGGGSAVNHLKRFVRAADLPASARYGSYVAVMGDDLKDRLYAPPLRRAADIAAMRWFDSGHAHGLLQQALHQDLRTYLPDDLLTLSDRLSMRHGLELRVPFLDHPLVEFCASLPPSLKIRGITKKYLLRKIAAPLVPSAVLSHRKLGFASPMASWLRGDLRGYVNEVLAPDRLRVHGLFAPSAVRALLDAHMSRRETCDRQLFALLMFQKWYERFM